MTKEELTARAVVFAAEAKENYVSKNWALSGEFEGMRLYDDPIFGFGAAEDPLFEEIKKPEAASEGHMSPREWLPGARSVVSWFLPYTQQVKLSNAAVRGVPSGAWLHGRVEGEDLNNALRDFVLEQLEEFGAVAPMQDARWKQLTPFSSNWSERHAAYICGLGTFSLSKGLITRKGVAGRFGSVVTGFDFQPDTREYAGLTDWCKMCGRCAENCPAGAIDPGKGPLLGKDHARCSAFLKTTVSEGGPEGFTRRRRGCGKCQTGVPCQDCAPGREQKNGCNLHDTVKYLLKNALEG